MIKKVAISDFELYNKIKLYFLNKDIELLYSDKEELLLNYKKYDLAVFYDEYNFIQETTNLVINIHPSLLPAYPERNAIIKAFNDGVKVSGITIHTKSKIIAQYPILIDLDTHIDDYIKELHDIVTKLLPIVIESVLNDCVFDFTDLFNNPCHKGGCSGCNGCH